MDVFFQTKPLIRPFVFTFYVVDEGFIDDSIASRSWVVARKVPIALVVGTRSVQITNLLINDIDFSIKVGWSQ